MRRTLALLVTATPLVVGTASLASLADVDLVGWSQINGLTGMVEGFGVGAGMDQVHWIESPEGYVLEPYYRLPEGASTRNAPRARQVGMTFGGDSTDEIDRVISLAITGTWFVDRYEANEWSGEFPAGRFTSPSARSYARLTAASVAQLSAYSGSGDLVLDIDSPLTTNVRLGVWNGTGPIVTLATISAGSQSATITEAMANSIGFEPTALLLLTESASSHMMSWAPKVGSGATDPISVEYWELQITNYSLVPGPGAISIIGVTGLLARRRRN